jgi:uncharacterized protein (DUF1810 family)
MNKETSIYLDHAEEYIQAAFNEISKAREQEEGTRIEALFVTEAVRKLQAAITVINRTKPANATPSELKESE